MNKQNGDDRETDRERRDGHKPANSAPDAVKDPNEKTDGKPGVPAQGDETDPGAG
ncbi:hypothetical protein [Methylorubrum extorquens]|uniref:hypothetical protein n=1 Tax=Methylorubrum extorquens TaxID=408 RepID=UPI000159064C|nr:hypothetical protein [Methylorubrum extorquens]ABY29375.1 hypothetical protein Mext_0970 [Methylorubrum extorquens PA1]WIU40715.1 hypothetical protein KQ926_05100 [Methylorubrum extorquens]